MQQNKFGSNGPIVSRLGYGAMGLAGSFGSYDEKEYIRSIHSALDLGVNFIDTARAYGQSERIIGEALKHWSGSRPYVATKVKPCGKGGWGSPIAVEDAFPRGQVRESVEASLMELQLDTLDLVQMHQYWPAWDDSPYWLEELVRLKEDGKVRQIGISIPDHRHDTALSLVRTGQIDSVQSILNIFDPIALDSLIPLCEKQGVAFIARCVLDEGGLTGFLAEYSTFDEGDFRNGYFDAGPRSEYIARVEQLKAFVPEHASSLAALAIKFALHHKGVSTAIISMPIQQYAEQNAAVLQEAALPDEVFD
jgi:aryl-alcohol dehydrogenase-like predicted oxidoreductase